jgi:hypothetical protein
MSFNCRSSHARPSCFGGSSSGSKETVIIRLLTQRELRTKLSRFADNPEELATCHKRESLRDMCRGACIWLSGNKCALSAGAELARSVPHARPSVFTRNAIAAGRKNSLSASKFCPELRSSDLSFPRVRESLTSG